MIRFLTVILLFAVQIGFAQRLFFSNYPLIDKNVQLGTHIIEQDENGLIFVASGNLLYSFDGLSYNRLLTNIEPARKITSIYCVGRKPELIFLGLDDGRLFCNKHDTFDQMPNQFGVDAHAITGIVMDKQDRLWVSTYGGGLFVRVTATDSFVNVIGDDQQDIYGMTLGPKDKIWICTDHGISCYDIIDDRVAVQAYGKSNGLSDQIVKGIVHSGGQLLLATHEAGVVSFDVSSKKFTNLTPTWPHGAILDLKVFGENECWILTEREGVFTLNLSSLQLDLVRDKNGLACKQVNDLLLDDEGNVWMCSPQVSLSRASRFLEFYQPSLTEIQMIYPESEHQVWLGTSSGLYRYDLLTEVEELITSTTGLNIISIGKIDSQLLLGTYDDGLVVLDLTDGTKLTFTESSGLLNNSVIALVSHQNRLWMSTLAGVCYMEFQEIGKIIRSQRIHAFDKLTNDYVYDILPTDEAIYFATNGHGVAELRNGAVLDYKASTDGNNQIFCLAANDNGDIWAVESEQGLCLVDRQNQILITNMYPTGSEILSISSDGLGHLIVLRSNGLELVSEESGELHLFGVENGFNSFQPVLNGIKNFQDKFIFAASQKEVLKFMPQLKYGGQPQIRINYVKAGSRALKPDENYVLGSEEHTLQFNLTGLFYLNPESVNFQYKLEGHDELWKETSDQNIIYSKLSPGEYIFKARAISSATANLEVDTAEFVFEILSPFWKMWWFQLVAFIVILTIILALVKHREREIKREKELQNAVIERQYQMLKNQLNPHFLFNAFNILVSYIEEEPKIAVEVVERLADFYRRILELKENKLVPIRQELELLDDYVYLLNKRFSNKLLVDISIQSRHDFIPPMTLQLLVENAVKHNILSERHPLQISIHETEENTIEVSNKKRKKRQKTASTGVGLKNIGQRYTLLGYPEMKIEETDGYFKVIVPILKAP